MYVILQKIFNQISKTINQKLNQMKTQVVKTKQGIKNSFRTNRRNILTTTCFALLMLVMTGCSKKPKDDPPDISNCNLKASITLAEGWQKVQAVNGERWEKDGYPWGCIDLFTESFPSDCKTADDFVKWKQGELKKNLNAVIGASSTMKVGGRDAIAYEYTSFSVRKDKLIHICIGTCVYSINVGSLTMTYENPAIQSDFQAMINSYTLK